MSLNLNIVICIIKIKKREPVSSCTLVLYKILCRACDQIDGLNKKITLFIIQVKEFLNKKMAKGGKREGAGRPVGTNKANKAQTHSIRLTDADYYNFMQLGGVKWLREAIKEAMKNIIQ